MTEHQPPGKSVGKGMLIAAWLLVLIGLTAFFNRHQQNRFNPNQSLEGSISANVRQVVLERNAFGHYVATGSINGHSVTFMLDTGATQVAIPAELGPKLGLTKGNRQWVSTANGDIQVWATTINRLELGPISLRNVHAALNPGMTGDEILLGMSALKSLEFSQRGRELTLRQYER